LPTPGREGGPLHLWVTPTPQVPYAQDRHAVIGQMMAVTSDATTGTLQRIRLNRITHVSFSVRHEQRPGRCSMAAQQGGRIMARMRRRGQRDKARDSTLAGTGPGPRERTTCTPSRQIKS